MNDDHQPKLVLYARTSQGDSIDQQVNSLYSSYLDVYNNPDYWLNGQFFYEGNVLVYGDVGEAGDTINSELSEALLGLTSLDTFATHSVDRLTRMDIRDSEYAYLKDQLFDNDVIVKVSADKGSNNFNFYDYPVNLNSASFDEMATKSEEWYTNMRIWGDEGRASSTLRKKQEKEVAFNFFVMGFTAERVGKEIKRGRTTVNAYRKELESEGRLKPAKRGRPKQAVE